MATTLAGYEVCTVQCLDDRSAGCMLVAILAMYSRVMVRESTVIWGFKDNHRNVAVAEDYYV